MIKTKKTTPIYLLLVLSLSCTHSENNAKKTSVIAIKSTPHFIKTNDDACFDASMEAWFLSFNFNQEQGLTLYEADAKALQDAYQEFNSCEQETIGKTRNSQASYAVLPGI